MSNDNLTEIENLIDLLNRYSIAFDRLKEFHGHEISGEKLKHFS